MTQSDDLSDEIFVLAPEGKVWLCGGCGKRARTQSGCDKQGRNTAIDRGYDEACMMNSALVDADEAERWRHDHVQR